MTLHEHSGTSRPRVGRRLPRYATGIGVAALLAVSGCGGSNPTTAAPSSPPPSSAVAAPAPASPAPATASPSPDSTAPNSTAPDSTAQESTAQSATSNAAVCRQLQKDAQSLQKGGPASTPDELAERLTALAEKWKKTAAQAKDPKLRSSVQKATSALDDLADSSGGGKKVSLAELQTKLKSADAGLRKACPKPAATA